MAATDPVVNFTIGCFWTGSRTASARSYDKRVADRRSRQNGDRRYASWTARSVPGVEDFGLCFGVETLDLTGDCSGFARIRVNPLAGRAMVEINPALRADRLNAANSHEHLGPRSERYTAPSLRHPHLRLATRQSCVIGPVFP